MSNSKIGKRRARATGDVSFGMSSNGNLQIAVCFELNDQNDPFCGEQITWVGTFAEGKASEIALQALETCGWVGDDVMDMIGIDSNDVELVIVEDTTADGTRQYDKVAFVNRIGASRFEFQKPLEGNALRAQAKGLTHKIREIRVARGSATQRMKTNQKPEEEFRF